MPPLGGHQLVNTAKVAQVLKRKLRAPSEWAVRSNSGKLCKFNATKLRACLPASDLCGQNHDRAHLVCIMRHLMSHSNKQWMRHSCNRRQRTHASYTATRCAYAPCTAAISIKL